MAQISVVIIAHNEEKNLPPCLEAARRVADEIIVVDSGSEDRTPEICLDFGVNYQIHPWEGYSGSKNFGTSLARYSWILSLDADEVLSEELIQQILKVKVQPSADAYSMNRLTNYCGKWIRHSGWYPDTKIRLWKKEMASWKGDVHEELVFNGNPSVILLHGDLLHYSIPSRDVHRNQIEKYSGIWAESAYNSGKKAGYMSRIFKPAFRFISTYFFKLGFLDGRAGFAIASGSARSIYLRYSKLRNLYSDQLK